MDVIEEDDEDERTYSNYKMKRPLFPIKAKPAEPEVEVSIPVGDSTTSVTPITVEDVDSE